MREILTERALGKGYDRQPVDLYDFFNTGQHRRHERLALGDYTATNVPRRQKFIARNYYPATDYELARLYLDDIWRQETSKKKKRVGFTRDTFKFLELATPAYFRAPVRGDLAYVDINSCYFQLYAPLTLDLHYTGERCGLGRVHFLAADWLRAEKPIRNGVVGIAHATTRREYQRRWESKPPAFREIPTHNRFLAPELWGYLMHTLHTITAEAISRFPIHYVNTDGFITDAASAADLMDYFGDQWHLESSIRGIGPGELYGYGSFSIGEAATATVHGSGMFNYVMPYDPLLAQRLKRWRKWALSQNGGR